MSRPDQSFFLAHFTKNGDKYTGEEKENSSFDEMSARQRLISILQNLTIKASTVPWVKKKVVCFTECPWGSLLRHAEKYSPYGIGFTKKLIYSRKGNPVLYLNPELFNLQQKDNPIYPFINPFLPLYASENQKKMAFHGRIFDYTHEREWRLIRYFKFQYTYTTFVVLKSVSDLKVIPDEIRNAIGLDKFIFMDTYRKIEELCPTHLMK